MKLTSKYVAAFNSRIYRHTVLCLRRYIFFALCDKIIRMYKIYISFLGNLLKAEADALKAERDSFSERLKTTNNKIENLQKYLQNSLAGEKFKTARLSISYRNTPSVNVTNFDDLPFEFKRFRGPEADKAKIRQALKNGQTVPGAELVTNTSMIIK